MLGLFLPCLFLPSSPFNFPPYPSFVQVFHVELVVKSPELVFEPPLTVLEDIVDRLISAIVESAQRLPRVEHVLFPGEERFELLLPAVEISDEVVFFAKREAMRLVTDNYPGGRK